MRTKNKLFFSLVSCYAGPLMMSKSIICKPTLDTFARFGVVLAAFFGFGLYFFYDASIGYHKANEAFCSYHAFAKLGQEVSNQTAASWSAARQSSPLLATESIDGVLNGIHGEHRYPLPQQCEAAHTCPPEAADFAAMNKSWNECWTSYSARMRFPITPAEHGHDAAAIREQWYAGGVCMLISAVLVALIIRTAKRTMSLEGDTVTAAGRSFKVSDITRLDLRQWSAGHKGVAYATVNGKRVRLDGMTYGGFNKAKGEPAEQWMKALLEQYKGEIIDYEKTDSQSS